MTNPTEPKLKYRIIGGERSNYRSARYTTEESRDRAAQSLADRYQEQVLCEVWSADLADDPTNRGWGCDRIARPSESWDPSGLNNRGWLAEYGDDEDEGFSEDFPWHPALQVSGAILPLACIWMGSEADCNGFIEKEIIGKGWIPRMPGAKS